MKFRTEVNIPPQKQQISYHSRLLLMGSCFTENIGEIMKDMQFRIDVNPFGVNYNPSSVARNLWTLTNKKEYSGDDLHTNQGKWFSFDHHSDFSNSDPDAAYGFNYITVSNKGNAINTDLGDFRLYIDNNDEILTKNSENKYYERRT